MSSAFSVLKQESTEPQISQFLSTATSYWGIHFFTTLIQRLWSVHEKIYEELERFEILALASFVADRVLQVFCVLPTSAIVKRRLISLYKRLRPCTFRRRYKRLKRTTLTFSNAFQCKIDKATQKKTGVLFAKSSVPK